MDLRYKKFFNYFVLILLIYLCSYFWQLVEIPFKNSEGTVGFLSKIKYNPINDTIRYVLFVGIPLLYYLFFVLKIRIDKQTYNNFFLQKFEIEKSDFSFRTIWPIFILLFIFLVIEFLSLKSPSTNFLDPLHHGVDLVPIINYLNSGQFWQSSFTIHGGANIFYPLIAWKLFGVQTIGAFKVFKLLLIFILKILSIIFIFYISKFSNLEKKYKVFLFSLLSLIILSLSNYYLIDYLSIRDLYALIFFIFFIQCFFKSERLILNFLISLTAIFTVFLHVDIGIYLCIFLLSYNVYLLFSKKFKDFVQILSFLILSVFLVYLLFGKSEISAFIFQANHIISSVDIIHGLKYPQPFFSMGIEPDGSRATKAIILQLICGIIVLTILFSKSNYFKINEKLFFLFFYVYCFIAFRNALGRSDGFHIMQSSDWQSIIFYFFIVHLIIFLFKKNNFIKLNLKFSYLFSILLISSVMLSNINFNNIINFKTRFDKSISAMDTQYMSPERENIVNLLNEEMVDEKCIQNFTNDTVMPYLMKKPTCTKYFSSWLASGLNIEKNYIDELKNKKVKYILYSSPMWSVDDIKTKDRLKYVNEFILDNYTNVFKQNDYSLLKLKD